MEYCLIDLRVDSTSYLSFKYSFANLTRLPYKRLVRMSLLN